MSCKRWISNIHASDGKGWCTSAHEKHRKIKMGRKMWKIEKQGRSEDDESTAWKHWMPGKTSRFTGIFIVHCSMRWCLLFNMLHNDVSNNNNNNGNSLPRTHMYNIWYRTHWTLNTEHWTHFVYHLISIEKIWLK